MQRTWHGIVGLVCGVAALTGSGVDAALVSPTISVTTTYSSPSTTNMALRVAESGSFTQERFRPIVGNRSKVIAVSGSDINLEANLDLCWQDFPTNTSG